MFCCGPASLQIKLIQLDSTLDIEDPLFPNLLDLHSKAQPQNIIKIHSLIFRNGVQSNSFRQGHASNPHFLLQMDQNMQDIIITQNLLIQNRQTLWRVLNKVQQRQIEQRQKIKLGQTLIQIYQICKYDKFPITQQQQQKNQCRYCFGHISTQDDPLITLCKCTGSVKYYHLSCLREWLNSKGIINNQGQITFFVYKKPLCQLCKANWPLNFKHNKKKYRLLQFQNNQDNNPFYVIHLKQQPYYSFDSSQQEYDYDSQVFLKINTSRKIMIGKSIYADIILDSYGVEQFHCFFVFQQGKLILKDYTDRVGTLVSTKKVQQFKSNSKISFVYGDRLIFFQEQSHGFFNFLKPQVKHRIIIKRQTIKQSKFQMYY